MPWPQPQSIPCEVHLNSWIDFAWQSSKAAVLSLVVHLFLTLTFLHLADAFIQSNLQYIQVRHFFGNMCVPWELNPQPFALLTLCSTTEPQEHFLCSSTLFPSTQLSVNMLGYSTPWTASFFGNECLWLTLLVKGVNDCLLDNCQISILPHDCVA